MKNGSNGHGKRRAHGLPRHQVMEIAVAAHVDLSCVHKYMLDDPTLSALSRLRVEDGLDKLALGALKRPHPKPSG